MIRFEVHTEGLDALPHLMKNACTKAERALAEQVRDDTRPFVPFRTGSLDDRTRIQSVADGGTLLVYPGPYARYLYFGKVMVDAATGRGPAHFKDENGNELLRFPKGSTLMATDRNLVFTTDFHPQAQAHWFEASKAQNLEKWERVAEKAVKHEF